MASKRRIFSLTPYACWFWGLDLVLCLVVASFGPYPWWVPVVTGVGYGFSYDPLIWVAVNRWVYNDQA